MAILLALLFSLLTPYTLACNHTLTSDYGAIRNSGNRNCTWTIRSANQKIVKILITTYYFDCRHHYYEIYNEDGFIRGPVCGDDYLHFTYPNMIAVKYVVKSDPGNLLDFRAVYLIRDENDQCGDILGGFYDLISPPRENGLMLNNVDCVWLIPLRADDWVLKVFFIYMELEIHGACEDTLQVKELKNGTVNLIGSYCGTKTPETLVSMGEGVVVELRSDNDNPFRGFSAGYEVHTISIQREILTSPIGTFEASRDGNEVGPFEKMWLILGEEGDKLKLIFTRVSMEESDSCSQEYLQVFDALYGGGTLFKSCTMEVGKIYELNSHIAAFYYFSNKRSRGNGFSLTYYIGQGTCGGLFLNSNGNLSFPSTGERYDNMMFCSWGFVGLPGDTVTFDIITNDMDDNCTFDSLKVYDGMKSSSSMLLEVCSNSTGTAVSTGHQLHLVFQSDASDTYHGFTAQWKIEYEGCGGILLTESGTIASDDRVPSRALHCEWIIMAKFDNFIEVNFTNFDLLSNAECDVDYIEIRSGDNADSPLLLRTCDFDTAKTFLSITNLLYIIYHSSTSSDRTGVSATFNTGPMTCGGSFSDPAGQIDFSAGSENCIWVIGGTPGSVATLLFESFNLQSSVDCNDEFIEIHDGNGTLLLKACGTDMPSIIHGSSWNPLILTFRTYNIMSSASFNIVYHISGPGCGSLELSEHGIIEPPRDDGQYLQDAYCPWLIYGQPGQKVVLYNEFIDLNSLNDCNEDWLAVFDGMNVSSPYIYETCQVHGVQEAFESTGRSLLVLFNSGTPIKSNGLGFTAHYEIFDEPLGKEILTSDINILSASRNGSNEVIHREWHIVGAPGERFKMYFTKFFLDTIHGCDVDYFEIRNGWHASSPLIVRSCDFSVGTIYEYNITEVFIIFHSENISRGDGFTLGYHMGTDNCGGLIVSKEGNITYPDTGENYRNLERCQWLVMGFQDELISVNISELSMGDCEHDNLTLYDGVSNKDAVLLELCNTSTGDVQTSSNVLAMVFMSDNADTFSGFTGRWLIDYDGCGKVFIGPSGEFSSDNKVANEDLRCEWHIIGKFDSLIELNLTEYDMGPNCNEDYVEIRNGDGPDSPLAYRLCGNSTDRFFLLTSQVFIVYYSSQTSQATGISASFNTYIEESTSSTTTEESTASTTLVSNLGKAGRSNNQGVKQRVMIHINN